MSNPALRNARDTHFYTRNAGVTKIFRKNLPPPRVTRYGIDERPLGHSGVLPATHGKKQTTFLEKRSPAIRAKTVPWLPTRV